VRTCVEPREPETSGGNDIGVLMASLAGFTAVDWNTMALAIAARPAQSEAAKPVLEGLRALACELNNRMVLGENTETALALLETARQLVRGACRRHDETAQVGKTPAGVARTDTAQGGLAGWQIRALDCHIDGHLDTKLCLAALAGAVRLSPSYLCRACRQTLQCSPMQYVMQRRLLAARQLLRHSPLPLSVLALNCGFADQAHFTRLFRAAMGETPLRWRRMWQASSAPQTTTTASAGATAGTMRQSGAHHAS
jgi:AraC family transcriptional regulator